MAMTTSSLENQYLSSQIETPVKIMGAGWMRNASVPVLIPSFIHSSENKGQCINWSTWS